MKKTFTLFFAACLFSVAANAQKLERLTDDDFVLSIIQVTIDGKDCTEVFLENEAFLALYERDGKLYFANCWQKAGTQSYGSITILEHKENNDAEYPTETTSLLWRYANTYDDKTGTANILMRLTYRPISVAFELSILTESAELLIFKGYVNGSLEWKPF